MVAGAVLVVMAKDASLNGKDGDREVLVGELAAVDGVAAGAVATLKVASLNHEVLWGERRWQECGESIRIVGGTDAAILQSSQRHALCQPQWSPIPDLKSIEGQTR